MCETMPEEMQMFHDKNKETSWSQMPSVVKCSAMEGRKSGRSQIDGIDRFLARTEAEGYVKPVESDSNELKEFNKLLNATPGAGTTGDSDEDDEGDDESGASDSKYVKALKRARARADVVRQIKGKYWQFFMSSLLFAKSSQINGNRNCVPYLTAGGYWDSWRMFGILNTVFEGRDAHKFGKTMAKVEVVKFVTDRNQVTKNLWGPNLKRHDVLYLVVKRSEKGNYDLEKQLKYPSILSLENYGEFVIYPIKTHVNIPLEELIDLYYRDIFGKIQRAHVINVGTVLYDTQDRVYSFTERDKALGLPSGTTGIPPTLSESKKAMIGLPNVEVRMKRCGY